MAESVNWGNVDPAHLVDWLNRVSYADGMITFMFGGHGHYYKATVYINHVPTIATGETADAFIRATNRVLERLAL